MQTVIGMTSQVTRSWQPDHVYDRSPDSVEFGAEIGGFRAQRGRRIAKIGHLTLDQEIEGSNPSSPAKPQHRVVPCGLRGHMLWIGGRSADFDRASGTYPLVR